MKALFLGLGALTCAAALTSCGTIQRTVRGEPGAEITRYHLGTPVARGQIAVEAFDQADANNAEFPGYAVAVGRQLSRLGYQLVSTAGTSEQIALIDVEQGSRAALASRTPAIRGGGRLSAGESPNDVATLLEVGIKRRSDGTIFWEGRAVSEARANSPESQRTAAVEKLAEALFRDFPGESGRTIRVR